MKRDPRPRTSFEEALSIIVRDVVTLDAEVRPLDRCAGRVLAEDVVAGVNVPAFARSAVDGFAVIADDLAAASREFPTRLVITASIGPAAQPPPPLVAGTCAHVATGAPLPEGSSAVVMIEDTDRDGEVAVFRSPVHERKHVIGVGEDVAMGERLLVRGRRLRPQDIGAVASLEIDALLVVRSPRVELVVTGDEIVPLGTSRSGTRVIDSNSVVLRQLAARDGADVSAARYVGDDRDAIALALRQTGKNADSNGADVVLVTGGSSVGVEDYAAVVLEQEGELLVRGVDVRPGGPTCFGRLGGCRVFLMPGHPLACFAAYEFFAGPVVRALGGRSARWPHRVVRAQLESRVDSIVGRTDYVRVRLNGAAAAPLRHHTGASNLSSAVRADGALIVPREATHLDAGEMVTVFLYD